MLRLKETCRSISSDGRIGRLFDRNSLIRRSGSSSNHHILHRTTYEGRKKCHLSQISEEGLLNETQEARRIELENSRNCSLTSSSPQQTQEISRSSWIVQQNPENRRICFWKIKCDFSRNQSRTSLRSLQVRRLLKSLETDKEDSRLST